MNLKISDNPENVAKALFRDFGPGSRDEVFGLLQALEAPFDPEMLIFWISVVNIIDTMTNEYRSVATEPQLIEHRTVRNFVVTTGFFNYD